MRDFLAMADAVVARAPGLAPCRATVEKEILHMEILEALRQVRAIPRLAFKRGTCLRLCRRGKRLSEDLEGDAFETTMRRFLPHDLAEEAVGDADYRRMMVESLQEVFAWLRDPHAMPRHLRR